jgi:hypothetical protein
MPQIPVPTAYKVNIIESERGWGSKIDEVLYFDNEAEARAYVKNYNDTYNTATEVPDWYMVAEYVGKIG